MTRFITTTIAALSLSVLIGLPALAERPSINMLNAAVNQLQAENNAQQADIDALEAAVDAIEEEFANVPSAVELFDANGQVLGVVIGVQTPWIPVTHVLVQGRAGGRSFAFEASNGLLEAGTDVYFESQDCSGQPYQKFYNSMVPRAAFIGPGANVYVPTVDATPQSVVALSHLDPKFPYIQPCEPCSEILNVVPLEFLTDLGEISPPFNIR